MVVPSAFWTGKVTLQSSMCNEQDEYRTDEIKRGPADAR